MIELPNNLLSGTAYQLDCCCSCLNQVNNKYSGISIDAHFGRREFTFRSGVENLLGYFNYDGESYKHVEGFRLLNLPIYPKNLIKAHYIIDSNSGVVDTSIKNNYPDPSSGYYNTIEWISGVKGRQVCDIRFIDNSYIPIKEDIFSQIDYDTPVNYFTIGSSGQSFTTKTTSYNNGNPDTVITTTNSQATVSNSGYIYGLHVENTAYIELPMPGAIAIYNGASDSSYLSETYLSGILSSPNPSAPIINFNSIAIYRNSNVLDRTEVYCDNQPPSFSNLASITTHSESWDGMSYTQEVVEDQKLSDPSYFRAFDIEGILIDVLSQKNKYDYSINSTRGAATYISGSSPLVVTDASGEYKFWYIESSNHELIKRTSCLNTNSTFNIPCGSSLYQPERNDDSTISKCLDHYCNYVTANHIYYEFYLSGSPKNTSSTQLSRFLTYNSGHLNTFSSGSINPKNFIGTFSGIFDNDVYLIRKKRKYTYERGIVESELLRSDGFTKIKLFEKNTLISEEDEIFPIEGNVSNLDFSIEWF